MVAVLAMVLTGVAFSAETIKVGHLADLTAHRGCRQAVRRGRAGVQELHQLEGGINGKQIEMQMFDYAYDKNKAVNQYKKFKEDKVVAIEGWGTGDTEALTGFINADKIRTSPRRIPPPDRREEDAVQLLLRRGLYLGAAGGPQVPEGRLERETCSKIVFIYPNHPYGSLRSRRKEYAKELGFEVLGDENVDLKAIEANSQLLSVKNKGADFAWIGGTTNSTAVILKDAKKLGLKTKFFSNIWGSTSRPRSWRRAEEGALVMAIGPIRGQGPGWRFSCRREDTAGDALHRGWVSMMSSSRR